MTFTLWAITAATIAGAVYALAYIVQDLWRGEA